MENKELLDQISKKYDDRYSLAISKDHHRGIVVQVARMNPTHVADNDSKISKVHRPVVQFQKIITLVTTSGGADPILTFKEKEKIQAELDAIVQQADAFAAKCIAAEKEVDQILLAYSKAMNGNG